MMSNFNLKFTDTFTIVDNKRLFSISKCWLYLEQQGKSIYGSHFVINNHHKKALYKLLIYAIEDQVEMNRLGLDPNKGILLMGENFTGKTAMMRLTQDFYRKKRRYDIKSCRLLSHNFLLNNGYESLAPLLSPTAKVLVLDNMGTENPVKHFGNTCNVVMDIVEHFYEQRFDLSYPRLHITTTLSPTEISKKYGDGFRAMVKEMFNVVVAAPVVVVV